MTPRPQINRYPSGKPVTHGSSAYKNYGCRCDECTDANRRQSVRNLEKRKLRFRLGQVEGEHGTNTTYTTYGCRCDECTRSNRDHEADRVRRNPPCIVAECDTNSVARGWCNRHYKRWLHHGTTDLAGKELQPCGTRAAYERHRRNGEKACEPCLAAARIYHAVGEARRHRADASPTTSTGGTPWTTSVDCVPAEEAS